MFNPHHVEVGEGVIHHRLSMLPCENARSERLDIASDGHLPAPIDLFAQLLSAKLAFAPGERDMVLLHHRFELAKTDSSSKSEIVTASLQCFGTPEASAMASTVGKTLSFAALKVADGTVRERGVQGPYNKEVWEGVLDNLEESGIQVIGNWA